MNPLILIALFVAPSVTPSLASNLAASDAPRLPSPSSSSALNQEKSLSTARLLISGMRTKNCPVLVRMALSKLSGVKEVTADNETKTVTVTFDRDQVSIEKIQATIKDRAGFDSERLK